MIRSAEPADLALFRVAPALRDELPHLPLGTFPSPLQLHRIAGREILVKRDDICAGGYAGNKVRKLEFLLADARHRGGRRLITAGATGSHHGFATAWHGATHGFAVSLVLFPQRLTPHVREMLLLMQATGAELRWVRRMEAVPFGMWRARIAHRAEASVVVPPGGSSAVGALGYVNAGLELAEQLAAASHRPSVIHMAAGTLGTVAGLAIGLAWAGLHLPIRATRITSKLVTNERTLKSLVNGTVALLRTAGADPPGAAAALRLVRLDHDQIGTGYGHATDAARAAADAFAAADLHLDTTYTAKAAAALLSHDPPDQQDEVPLFWHTLSAVVPESLHQRLNDARAELAPPFREYLQRETASASGRT
jgi:1-aminocyclopropane-1-carboxylate deaminase/D-cysteine desulfhydrase-like pyridoxal-dependent ACC family enzyme